MEEMLDLLRRAAEADDGYYKLSLGERRNSALMHQADLLVEVGLVEWSSPRGTKRSRGPRKPGQGLVGLRMRSKGYEFLDALAQCQNQPKTSEQIAELLKGGLGMAELIKRVLDLVGSGA